MSKLDRIRIRLSVWIMPTWVLKMIHAALDAQKVSEQGQ